MKQGKATIEFIMMRGCWRINVNSGKLEVLGKRKEDVSRDAYPDDGRRATIWLLVTRFKVASFPL